MKIVFGLVVTDGVNSLGGQTVSKNHYGRFVRTKVTPTLVQNSYTAGRRNKFLYFTQKWADLSQANRDLWNAATGDYEFTDSLGNPYNPTGKNLYVSLNLNVFTVTGVELAAPPTKVIPTEDLTFTFNALTSAGAVSITFDEAPTDTDTDIAIYATESMSPGIKYVSTMLRLIGVFAVSGAAGYDIATEYIAKFGNPVINKKIFISAKEIHSTSGSAGLPFTLGEVVAT